MHTEEQVREHWDQLCLRHHEDCFEHAGVTGLPLSSDWEELSEAVRDRLRAEVIRLLEECERAEVARDV